MSPSTPPPPPDSSNTVTSTTPATTRPLFQYPPRPPNPHPIYSPPPQTRLPPNPSPNYPQLAPRPPHPQDAAQLLYPVASSGRGFVSRPAAMPTARPSNRPPFVFPYLDQGQVNPGFVRTNHLQHALLGSGSGSAAAGGLTHVLVNGVPVPSSLHPKVGPPASISDNNGQKDLRDRNRDESFAIIRDRKVRITDNASLYAICRSWLRNSYPEEIQPQYLDSVRSLPSPLPVTAPIVDSPDKTARDKEDEDEDNGSYENLSEKDLLQRHIKHAKKVRSRLREERLERITRYKSRLACLLPPMVEQQFKNESAAPN